MGQGTCPLVPCLPWVCIGFARGDLSPCPPYARADAEIKRKALEQSYPKLISEDISQWSEDKDLMNWLRDFCR